MTTTDFNELYKSFGYRKFKMSKFEPYDLYADYRDFLTSRELITFTDLDGTLLAMKPDITLSIIKNNTGEEKVYYNENVYRARNHHYREIQQVGVECVGKVDFYCEAEILAMRYGLGGGVPLTQREAAAKLGISRSYVSRIEKKALQKLRKRFEEEDTI